MKRISLLLLVLIAPVVTSAGAGRCPVGDLNGDCKVDRQDLAIFADQWLVSSATAANLDGINGVNLADFALLAESWLTRASQITLVINEFMAKNDGSVLDPYGDYDDWIEIYNYGDDAVDIGGMYLADNLNSAGRWRIPNSNPSLTTIPSHGYLLIWADEEAGEGILHASFKLSAGGEQIGLYDTGGNLIDSIVFGPQNGNESYGRLPDGSDNWQVFTSPTPGASNTAEPVKVVINEIMYHPYHALNTPENMGQEYIELFNRGAESVNLSGWRLTDGVEFTFPQVILGAGQYLVVAADVNAFTAKYPGVSNVVGGWVGWLSNSGERIELADNTGIVIDAVRYADEGDWAIRELGPVDHGHRGWQWSDQTDGGGGKSLELINPAMPNEYGQNWAASKVDNGTPGRANSVAANDVAPLILDVAHSPIIPGPNDAVTVTGRIINEQTAGLTVTLNCRVDGQPAFAKLNMFDDGQHGDGDSGDRVYGAQIPAQPDGAIIEFYIEASDVGSNTRTWPAPTLVDNVPQQVTNALYQVDDSFDPDWTPGSQPIYYLIMTEKERAELAFIGSRSNGEEDSDAQMNGTFISIDGVGTEFCYNVGIRNRGHGTRTGPPNNYHVNFPHDRPWKGVGGINFNCRYTHAQIIGSAIFHMAGTAAADTTPAQLRINGANLASSGSPMYGVYARLEAFNDDFAQKHFPDDPNGNLYTCFRDAGEAQLLYQGTNPNTYRNSYLKANHEAQDDFSDLIHMLDVLNNAPDATYFQDVSKVINVPQWLHYIALDSLLVNYETGLNMGIGDDYFLYCGVVDPRFVLIPHDLDTILDQGNAHGNINQSIFSVVNGVAGYNGVDGLKRFFSRPEVIALYYQAFLDNINQFFNPETLDPLFDQVLGGFTPQDRINAMKQFVRQRTAAVLAQIPQQFTVGSDLSVNNGYHFTPIPVATGDDVKGSADAINTRSVLVNGRPAEWSQVDGKWSLGKIILPLSPGINRVIVQAFDSLTGSGKELERGHIDIWYDTGSTNDYPKAGGGSNEPAPSEVEGSQPIGTTALRLIVPDNYLPGVPVLVRLEVLGSDGVINRNLWNAVATLSVQANPGVNLSTNQVTLYNGLGSALVGIAGGGDFTLTAEVNGSQAIAALTDLSSQSIKTVSRTLSTSATWSGIYHITGGDFTIPDGVTLTLNPGTLVLIDGVPSGENGLDIEVAGSIKSLGTASAPVVFTAYTAGRNWGELRHVNAEPSTFQYTIITQAGHSPRVGHSNSGPAIRASNSAIVFDHACLTDNAGKIMHTASGCDLTFRNCLFARSIMGPEIAGTALLFEDNWITDMHGSDDADGIYIHSQQAGQQCVLRGGVAVNMNDDGVDTLGSEVTIEDFIVRDCKDKAVSIYGGQVDIKRCLIVENNKAPEDPTVATIATKTVEGATAIVNIDRATIVTSKIPGYSDIGIQSHNKYGVTSGTIIYNVTNSIIDATNPIDVQAPYLASDIHVGCCDIFGQMWPGAGNINADPLFVDKANHDYRLRPGSPCIDAGDPAAEHDPDLTVVDQGYFWFDQGLNDPPQGSLVEDTVWTPEQGPYRITGELTVPVGVTLTIMPVTTVFFDPNARVVIRGRLVAEGTQYALIRFTRTPGANGTWNGLQFVSSLSDNRIAHAVLEYGQTNDGMIGLKNSKLLIDHVTFDNTIGRRICTNDSSLIVRNSVFTDTCPPGQAPTDNLTEHIWGGGIPANGQFIIENNLFGVTPGHNDAIDFDGASRPNPIPQILDNIFLGGGDDALDLETDAHIEGNFFMNYIKDQYNKASGESNGISAGGGREYTMVRNVFHNVQHVAQVKDNAFLTFVNNTVAGASAAAIYFDLDLPGRGPGRGAYVDGTIFWDTATIFAGVVGTTQLAVHRSIISSDWHHFGQGNIDADPLFVDGNQDFHLKPMSPAIGGGPCQLDMGAYVPSGAAICGEPDQVTSRTSATLTVGGPGVTHYKYSVNDPNGLWSQERPASEPIALTGLVNGQSYAVYVLGRNSAGIWQSSPKSSRTWRVDVSYRRLVINEVLAINNSAVEHESTFPDMIELLYDGPTSLSLSGMSISDNAAERRRFVFPASVIMTPGEYLVLYADSNTTTSGIHLGFALDGTGDAVYLSDKSGVLIDSVEFGLQLPDLSIGRVGYGGNWHLTKPTFGGANITQPLGNPDTLKINEWLANGQVLFEEDFIELYNPHANPVDLGGMYLTNNPVTQPDKHKIGPLNFVAGTGYAVFTADESSRSGHVSFRLSADGEILGLFDANLNQIDKVLYGPQTTDVSQGRAPDGAKTFQFFVLPTPGVANPASTKTTITLAAETADKRVLVPTVDIGDAWRAADFNDLSWAVCSGGPGGVGYERSSGYDSYISLDVGTQMYNRNASCYIRIPFVVDSQPSQFSRVVLSVRYDDGFIAYLNGAEVARRNFTGTPRWNSAAGQTHDDSAAVVFEDVDISEHIGDLRQGANILAIHGLNTPATSLDFLISAELVGTIVSSQDQYIAQAVALLDGLRVTELMYHAAQSSNYDFIELQNISDVTLDLTGVRFTKGVEFTFGQMQLSPGEFVVVAGDLASFRLRYGSSVRVAGQYSGNLSNNGEDIVLKLALPLEAAIMRFGYSDRWHPTTDGGGQSLVIVDPMAHPATWSQAQSWQPADPTPGKP